MTPGHGRVLPLRVPLAPGEGIDSWLEALARRNGLSLRALLRELSLPVPSLTSTLFTTITPAHLRYLEHRCQLPDHHLDQALPDSAFPLRTRQARGSRYCPNCLAERGGRWKLTWWLPGVFACTSHQALLHDACPGCGARPRRILPGRTRAIPAGLCTRHSPDGLACGTDLRATPAIRLPADSPLLSAQQWIDELLTEDDLPAVGAVLSDLHHLSRWLLHALPDQEVSALGPAAAAAWADRPTKAPPDRVAPFNAPLTAIITHHARPLLGSCDDTAVRRIQQLRTQQGAATALHPSDMTMENWKKLSPRLRGRFLHATDAHLTHLDRVRLNSGSPNARIPAPGETPHVSRARHVPQLLWPHWTLRFLPPSGLRVDLFRGTAAALLFLPGAGDRDKKALLQPLHAHLPNYVAHTLQVISHSGYDQVFPAICRIADYLDEHGSEIDYQQRRTLIAPEVISETAWQELCFRTNTHPGEASTPEAPGRLLHARRHLFQLLTGADLCDPRHALAWKNASDRSRYIHFTLSLSLAQREALFQHAQELLESLGIDEPVTWEPPESCCHGLDLPGPRLDDIDLGTLQRLVIAEGRQPSAAARLLNTTVTHVRLALEHIDQGPREWAPTTRTAAWKLRERARTILTPALLQREYTEQAKTLTRIAQETGIPRHVVVEQARAVGLTIYYTRRPVPMDEPWLRTQYLDLKRSTASIAAELGTEDETVRRRLRQLGIPLRPPGVHSRTVMTATLDTTIPRELRTAVEGSLHGWLRLHRFQIAIAFPSLETAADYLNTHQGSLVHQFQRLERDLGHRLFHRSAFGKPHRPTTHGKALLRALDNPDVITLMTTAIGADGLTPQPDAGTLAQAQDRLHTRKNPGPLKPFADITVTRIRITGPTLTLLRDLLDHQDEEFYGAQIHARTGIDNGTLYPQLKRMERAGWLTSRLEPEESWIARAPVGCGPGRRRTYYTLTPGGLRAATHEVQHHRPRRKDPDT
ncbi:TniQ family protein [Streptomyces afghaniensis]|uniref:TniQ family protein n=1 Tax=Streptomyces afghaniensis TaxID=66865 RepID=UPI00278822C8|nr:TniQ family protein [Streptomyces afghaniensis]MDQ1016910.1 DNA-binding MarR family transcriptional regulator [Streptomyces afghaniensis]